MSEQGSGAGAGRGVGKIRGISKAHRGGAETRRKTEPKSLPQEDTKDPEAGESSGIGGVGG
jgi:hypothetical protein